MPHLPGSFFFFFSYLKNWKGFVHNGFVSTFSIWTRHTMTHECERERERECVCVCARARSCNKNVFVSAVDDLAGAKSLVMSKWRHKIDSPDIIHCSRKWAMHAQRTWTHHTSCVFHTQHTCVLHTSRVFCTQQAGVLQPPVCFTPHTGVLQTSCVFYAQHTCVLYTSQFITAVADIVFYV